MEEFDENQKYAFDLLTARKEKIERRLTRNLIFQLSCVVIGLSFVCEYDLLIVNVVENYMGVEPQLIRIVIPIFLVYLFIEFGFAFGQFIFINRTHKKLFKLIFHGFYKEYKIKKNDFKIAFESLSVFSQIQADNKSPQGRIQKIISMIVISAILLAGHFTAYSLVDSLICGKIYVILVKTGIAAALLFFYWIFLKSNKTYRLTSKKLTQGVCMGALAVFLYSVLVTCLK